MEQSIASAQACIKEADKWRALYEETGESLYYTAWQKAEKDVAFFLAEAVEKM